MKTNPSQFHFRSVGLGILLGLVPVALIGAEATPSPTRPSGPPKVRVLVKENSVATTAGATSGAATPAPAGAANRPQGQGGKQPGGAGAQAASALDAEKYTRTSKKTLTIDVVNLTTAGMEVTVKATLLGKDEAGKHEVLPEKTVEN